MTTMTPVRSSLIAAVGFDEASGELLISFPRGKTYAYKGASVKDHYNAMMNPDQESVGKYFLQNVKNKSEIEYRALESEIQVPESASDPAPNQSDGKKTAGLKAPEPLKQLF